MPADAASSSALLASDADLLFEEDLLRNAYSLKYWVRYIDAKHRAPARQRNLIAERALKYLPGSYKIWRPYLADRIAQVKHLPPDDPAIESVNRTFERAIVYMHKMPRLWEDYLTFLVGQHRTTATRHAFDRALRALPITQHERIWKPYLAFAKACQVPETAVRIYRRYLQFEPEGVEEYIDFLLSLGRVSEAALKLAEMLNRETVVSTRGKSRHALWMELCELVTKNPREVQKLRVEPILRSGLRTFTDEAGHLWCALADYFIRQASFEQARDVYEEAIASVVTVRDFSMLFDAYSQFEESLLTAKLEAYGESALTEEQQLDVDMRLARLERLMERRPELLSSVLLRQSPHNVHEWLKRAALFEETPAKVIHTYATAVKTVEPSKAIGKPHSLWLAFAKYYEEHSDLRNARVILRKATLVPYKSVDDLAAVWMGWAEMELRHKQYEAARAVLKEATAIPPPAMRAKKAEESGPVQARLYKHTKLWTFFCDVQESLGTFEEAKAAYTSMLELRIITPQLVLNFGTFLEEHKHFEAAFQAYERGIAAFKYPYVLQIWLVYLDKFVTRFGGAKLERARDLFEQALDKCPPDTSAQLYRLYAHLEEKHGMMRNAMALYQRAVETVAVESKLAMYNEYIAKAAEYFGVTKTRDIYQHAIDALPSALVPGMCERYANLERKLGEVDRARAIYMHGAQLVDPASGATYWGTWHEFEVAHGNEDTFREMLRMKRAVSAAHTQAAVTHARPGGQRPRDDVDGAGAPADAPPGGGMAALEEEQQQKQQRGAQDGAGSIGESAPSWAPRRLGADAAALGFTAAEAFEGARPGCVFKMDELGLGYYREGSAPPAAAAVVNEEIDIDDDEDGGAQIQQVAVPAAVFGAAGMDVVASEAGNGMGALERFKRAQGL